MNRIIKNSSLLIGTEIFCRLGAFVLAVWTTRLLGAENSGKISFAMSFGMIFAILSDFGINIITIREMSREIEQAKKYTSNMLVFRLFLALISWGLIFIAINILGYESSTKNIVYMLGCSIIINSYSETINVVFRSFEKMEFVSISMIIQRLLPLALGLFILLKGYGLSGFAFAYLLASVFNLVVVAIFLGTKFFIPKLELDYKFCLSIVKKSLPLGIAVVFAMLYFRIGIIMLSKMQGDAAVGWFSASYRLIESVMFIPVSIMGALLPVFSKLYVIDPGKLVKDSQKTIELLLTAVFPIVAGLFILSDKIIIFLYGKQFINSINVLRLLVWADIFIFVNYVLSHLLVVCNRQKYNTVINVTGCIVTIGLNLFLIPRFSYIGVSITTVLNEMVMFILSYIFLRKFLGNINLFKIAFKPLSASLIMSLCVLGSHSWNLFLSIFIGFIVYLLSLFLMGSFKIKGKIIWVPS